MTMTNPGRALTVAIIALVPLATVGPNLGGSGVRTEHIYAVAAAGVLLLVNRGLPRLAVAYWLVLLAWVLTFTIVLIGKLMPIGPPTYPPIEVALGRFGVPILGMIIGAYLWSASPASNRVDRPARPSLLDILLFGVVAVACINTMVAVMSVATELPWLGELFRTEGERPVAEFAAGGGRFAGMINQPIEAGILYSTALLAVSRLWMTRVIPIGWFAALAAGIAAGGAMSGAKGFLFGGLPVAVVYIVLSRRPSLVGRLAGVGLAAATALVAAWYVLAEFNRPGLERISIYLPWRMTDPRYTLFGGRLDSDSRTLRALESALGEAGPFALGAPYPGSYDFGAIEFVTVAGWSGVAVMVLIGVVLLVTSLCGRREGFWVAFTVVVVAANLGGPSFTANRTALVTWVLFGAMLQLTQHRRQAGPRPPRPATATSRTVRVG